MTDIVVSNQAGASAVRLENVAGNQPLRLTAPQREALEWLARGKSLRGLAHGVTINHLRTKRLIQDSDTITDAGRAALAALRKVA